VPGDDLTSVPGLQDKHRRVLAEQLEVTTLRALADADPRDIHHALRNLRPRPTFEQIASWQDNARSGLGEATIDSSDWHPAASFAVVFAQRQVDGSWERRLEIERTEVEPEQDRKMWPGWDCGEICGWMRGQLRLPEGPQSGPEVSQPAPAAAPAQPAPAAAPAQPASAQPAARTPARVPLQIASAAVIGPTSRVDVVTAGSVAAAPLTDLTGPVRVDLTIAGARQGQEIHVVARVLREGQPGWNPQDPEVIRGSGQVSFDLSRLPAGQHDVMLVAWAPDGSANPAVVRLPTLTIRV
jgi:hypothetical protein